MDKKMRVARRGESSAEGKQEIDIPTLRRNPARLWLDNIVKPQLQTPIDGKHVQVFRLGPAGIENRQDVRHTRGATAGKFFDPANCQLEWRYLIIG